MAFPRKIKNFNAFVDGRSYFGIVLTGTMPTLELNTAEWRGGGMDAPLTVDMGMSALEATLVFAEFRPELLRSFGTRTLFVLRAAAQAEADIVNADALAFTMRGRITGSEPSEFGAGNDVTHTLTMAPDRYKIELAGEVLVDIDIEAGKRVIGGTDQTEAIRRAMGL